MSASDSLSTKCSGLLLRSSFAILAARTRHLISVAPRLSNSSDILLRASSEPPHRHRSPGACTRFKVLIYLKRFAAPGCGALVSTSKVLGQMNKTQDVGRATEGCSALQSLLVQSGKGRIASDPALLNLPRPLMAGAFFVSRCRKANVN